MTNVNDLRIVKLYHVHSFDKDEYGRVEGTNIVKDQDFFVLVKKFGNTYKIVPTAKFATKDVVKEYSSNLYDLVIKKERKNNRYRKPFHICKALEGKELTKEELIKFATMIESINCDSPEMFTTSKLQNACEYMEKMLENENSYSM